MHKNIDLGNIISHYLLCRSDKNKYGSKLKVNTSDESAKGQYEVVLGVMALLPENNNDPNLKVGKFVSLKDTVCKQMKFL